MSTVDLTCGCGCGEGLNPRYVAVVALRSADATLTHKAIAAQVGLSREVVSLWLRKPVKYLKGHNGKQTWGPFRLATCANPECNRAFRPIGAQRYCKHRSCQDSRWVASLDGEHLAIVLAALAKRELPRLIEEQAGDLAAHRRGHVGSVSDRSGDQSAAANLSFDAPLPLDGRDARLGWYDYHPDAPDDIDERLTIEASLRLLALPESHPDWPLVRDVATGWTQPTEAEKARLVALYAQLAHPHAPQPGPVGGKHSHGDLKRGSGRGHKRGSSKTLAHRRLSGGSGHHENQEQIALERSIRKASRSLPSSSQVVGR